VVGIIGFSDMLVAQERLRVDNSDTGSSINGRQHFGSAVLSLSGRDEGALPTGCAENSLTAFGQKLAGGFEF
jgi:hypothetical protein